MHQILPQIYTDKHGCQMSEILGDAYFLHLQITPYLQGFHDGTGLALSARNDESDYNYQTSLQARTTAPEGWSSI